MKILPANIAESYIRLVEEHSLGPCMNRPERVRIAIRELLRKEVLSSKILEEEAKSDRTNK